MLIATPMNVLFSMKILNMFYASLLQQTNTQWMYLSLGKNARLHYVLQSSEVLNYLSKTNFQIKDFNSCTKHYFRNTKMANPTKLPHKSTVHCVGSRGAKGSLLFVETNYVIYSILDSLPCPRGYLPDGFLSVSIRSLSL